jgi:hypothetical protein
MMQGKLLVNFRYGRFGIVKAQMFDNVIRIFDNVIRHHLHSPDYTMDYTHLKTKTGKLQFWLDEKQGTGHWPLYSRLFRHICRPKNPPILA